MSAVLKRQRRLNKIHMMLRNENIEVSATPTNILFVSKSSVLCGVSLESLEAVFIKYDEKCHFIVYPGAKSFSFVIFSTVEKAIEAFGELNDTRPQEFPEQSWPIALLYIKQVPQMPIPSASKIPNGLNVLNEFINEEEEFNLIKFLDSEETNSRSMKNRRVFHYGYEFDYSVNNAIRETQPIPEILLNLIEKFNENKDSISFKPDQITVNIYEPGHGIPPHVDTHSAFEEPIGSLSLSSDIVMEFRDCANARDSLEILLPKRSLLWMKGASRYRFKHGILSRKHDVNPINNKMFCRQKRISITFRQIRRKPCECPFIEFCDWDRNGKMALPGDDLSGKHLENEYVSKVYEQIAEHFDETRRSNWGVVNRFLDGLPKHSLLLDAGCGNGKYLIRKDSLIKLGCDICASLVEICHQKNCQVFRADALNLPIRSGTMDAAISIAVIHHFSTRQRRLMALKELERVLRRGGRACVTVWALEQKRTCAEAENGGLLQEESVYLRSRSRNAPMESSEETADLLSTTKLRVHDGKDFRQQDMLVPWQLPNSTLNHSGDSETSQKQFLRYYHLFVAEELANMVRDELKDSKLLNNMEEYEQGNWAVIFEKIS